MSEKPRRIVIVGGVAGGASAATRARRMNENADIILLEKDEYVSFANCGLPYHIGEEIEKREKLLVATSEFLQKRFRLDVRTKHEAIRIDRVQKTVSVLNHRDGMTSEIPYDKLILSTGASPLVPPLPGVEAKGVFTLRNVEDMDRIKEAIDASQSGRVIVVGAGFIGLELAEQLVHRGRQVTLAEMQPQVLPMFDHEIVRLIETALREKGIEVITNDGIKAVITDQKDRVTGIELNSGKAIEGSLVLLGLGVRPNVKLAQESGLSLGKTGGILVNDYSQTDDPNIYAVGDACEYLYSPTQQRMRVALAGPANRAGRLAGEHAATDSSAKMSGVLGTAIVRVFDYVVAMTGVSMRLAAKLEIAVETVTVVSNQHAGYYPGATPVTLKLVFDPASGRILGAQACGKDGVDKRIDVIATAINFNATVRDLCHLDLCYAPPFGSAKDPVHLAGFAACNHLDGIDKILPSNSDLTKFQVVDVRTVAEVEKKQLTGIDNAINIPVDDLRERLHELDSSQPTVVSCGVGVRAHIAARILRQNGFEEVYNLAGGVTVRNLAVTDE